jgi:hypothetical protein
MILPCNSQKSICPGSVAIRPLCFRTTVAGRVGVFLSATMKEKQCFKCYRILPLSEFYRNYRMPDGTINKCKDCAKLDLKDYGRRRRENPVTRLLDRRYHREKQAVRRAMGLVSKQKSQNPKAWRDKNPLKYRAHKLAASAVKAGVIKKPENCEDCGCWTNKLDKHHEDYSKPLAIVWLCHSCHCLRHIKMRESQLLNSQM